MLLDDESFDQSIVLTHAQWEELIGSVRSLSEANAKLMDVIVMLLSDTENHAVRAALSSQDALADPYDLRDLCKLVRGE